MVDKAKDDALREMAANRGCKLVKSRRRKPGGDYGRYGIADAKNGRKVFGFGKDGLEASAEEVEDFLRGSAVSTWKSSLAAAGKAPKQAKRPARAAARAPTRTGADEEKPKMPATGGRARGSARSKRPAAPKAAAASRAPLRIRPADSVDSEAVAPLVAEFGIPSGSDEIADRIQRLARLGEPPLLAKRGEEVVGCLTWHVMAVLHRPRPVGRISMLVVAAGARRQGVGAALVRAAEKKLAERGCGLVEVTSNEKLRAAHSFYRSMGYERTSHRFARILKE